MIHAAVSRQKASETAVPVELFRIMVTKIPDIHQAAAAETTNKAPANDLFICPGLYIVNTLFPIFKNHFLYTVSQNGKI